MDFFLIIDTSSSTGQVLDHGPRLGLPSTSVLLQKRGWKYLSLGDNLENGRKTSEHPV